jgi:hypothetical protein
MLNTSDILLDSSPWIARSLSQTPELRKRTFWKIFNSSTQTLASLPLGSYTHEDAEVIAATVAGMPDSLG